MMRRGQTNQTARTIRFLAYATVVGTLLPTIAAAEPVRPTTTRAPKPIPRETAQLNVAGLEINATRISLDDLPIKSPQGGVAGAPPGFTVYENTIDTADPFAPGANILMADDLTLANGACNVVYYSVFIGELQGSPSFDVTTELWSGDPCLATSSPLANSAATTTLTPGPGTTFDVWELEFFLDATPVPAPGTVWLAVTFTSATAIWPVAGPAEVGSTANFFTLDDPAGCGLFNFPPGPHAGFYASINCDLAQEPTGACCQGTTCSELTQAQCDGVAGFFRGSFTTCTPDPCVPGACCGGEDFDTCTESNAADCTDGFFTPNVTCGPNTCGQNFRGFANVFNTGFFNAIDLNQEGEQVLWADDIQLEPGSNCELLCFDVLVTGGGEGAPERFNAHVELRQDVPGDPQIPFSNIPGAVIPGSARDFFGIDGDFLPHRLLVCVPPGLVLPEQFWIAVTTSAPTPGVNPSAGPLLGGGSAKVGASLDAMAAFDLTPDFPADEWFNGIFFGGFDPTGCPGAETCIPAGSIRASVWCRGTAPIGACCEDLTESCVDGLTQLDCPGRWQEGVTCASALFDPPCGTNACCVPTPLSPGNFTCQDMTISACEAAGGSSNLGVYCIDIAGECPSNACVQGATPGAVCTSDRDCGTGGSCVGCQGKTGDCFSENATPGCEDPFCCAAVSAIDDFCAIGSWDGFCVERAEEVCSRFPPNDNAENATPISAEGATEFDNEQATMDGPSHESCADFGTSAIAKDVYYCWTAPCTSTAFLDTCGQTDIDTKIAVYEGCGAPTDGNLIACNDDDCELRSRLTFDVVAGSQYLIRIGSFPGTTGGNGTFTITCGAAACPGPGNCCEENLGTTGCNDADCCTTVCACDSFCCGGDTGVDGEWDLACATTGFEGNGCGAELLCPGLCGAQTCPTGTVTFLDPVDGVVDAGYPTEPDDDTILLTPASFTVEAPIGADATDCWSVCETATTNGANEVTAVIDNGGGNYIVVLARPMTPGAVTTLTYTANGANTVYTSHPANVNGDGASSATDVLSIIDCLNNVNPAVDCPWGGASSDVDRSNATNASDVLGVIDLLNGAGAFPPWINAPRPDASPCIP